MIRKLLVLSLMLLIPLAFCVAQAKIEKTPAPYIPPDSGKDMFKAYCASCHGLDAKGDGPVASALKAPIPDLTQLAKQNGGKFPADRFASILEGAATTPSHGSADMPVWGPVFLSVSHRQSAQVQQRIHNLSDYVESLQGK